jgi:hypothetical protein
VREVLQGLLIAGVAAWVACAVAVLWVRHRLRRELRIAPRVRSTAPTVWLVPVSRGARLHRRMRLVGATARSAATVDPTLGPLADDLVRDTIALEPGVVSLRRTGRAGGQLHRRLRAEIDELESVARRLTLLSTTEQDRPSALSLRDRVAALEVARREVADIDRQAGLHIFA